MACLLGGEPVAVMLLQRCSAKNNRPWSGENAAFCGAQRKTGNSSYINHLFRASTRIRSPENRCFYPFFALPLR
jgi:hypothetical protein